VKLHLRAPLPRGVVPAHHLFGVDRMGPRAAHRLSKTCAKAPSSPVRRALCVFLWELRTSVNRRRGRMRVTSDNHVRKNF
jgi:hypothetical protein